MHQARFARLMMALTLLLLSAAVAEDARKASGNASSPPPANAAFEKFKSLAGDWEGKEGDGKAYDTNVRVVSAGSAVMFTAIAEDMITVVYPDGQALMATHYCSAKNQPRFVAAPSSDSSTVTFKFKDVTNLATPESGHMVGVVYTFVDADHYTEAWTWREGGKEQLFTMKLTRKKPATP